MTDEAPLISTRPMTDADEPAVLDLLTSTMAGGPTGERTTEFFHWKHRNSPFGASPGLVAVHEDRIVGVRLFLRWALELGGQTLKAVRAVDTATHPNYQRQGIFKRLTLTLLGQLESAGEVDLVFNTPNVDSRPGYLRMGWQEVGLLPIHLSPVRPIAFARGLRGANRANASGSAKDMTTTAFNQAEVRSPLPAAAEAFDDVDALERLLRAAAVSQQLHTPLTVPYLRWRYAEAPGLDYRCIPVQRHGILVGLGFARVRTRAGLAELTVGDVIVGEGDTAAARSVLAEARRSGVDHVAVHASAQSEIASQLWRRGYLRAPGRGIALVANPRRDLAVNVLEPSSWRLSLGDLEVF